MESYAYLSLVLSNNESYSTYTNGQGGTIPFTNAVNTSDIYLGSLPTVKGQSPENFYGYITLSTAGNYFISYMIQPLNPSSTSTNCAIALGAGFEGEFPSTIISNPDFMAYQFGVNTISPQIVGNFIYNFQSNQTLSLYQISPSSSSLTFGINGYTVAYICVCLISPNLSSFISIYNTSTPNPTTLESDNYNAIGSGTAITESTPTIITGNCVIPIGQQNQMNYDSNTGITTYDGTPSTYLCLFMVNLMGYGNASQSSGPYGGIVSEVNYLPYDLPNTPVIPNLFSFSVSNSQIFTAGVINAYLSSSSITSQYMYNCTYPTYQNFQLLGSCIMDLNQGDNFSLNCVYYQNTAVIQNQMYVNGSLGGVNSRMTVLPINNNDYIYLTNSNNIVLIGDNIIYLNSNLSSYFDYNSTTGEITILETISIIIYFSCTIMSPDPYGSDANIAVSLNLNNNGTIQSNVYSNNILGWFQNQYSITGFAIFQNVVANSTIYLSNVSGIIFSFPQNCVNNVLFIMVL